jgi:guanylate kinase
VKTLVAVFGKSGSGKDTLISKFCEKYGGSRVVRLTSRPPRPGESDGNPYIFKTDLELHEDIVENIEEYLEVGVFNDWIYTTKEDSLKEGINLGAFDIDAVEQLCYNNKEGIEVVPIFLYCNDKTRVLRQIHRDDDLKEIARRFLGDDEKYPKTPDEPLSFEYVSLRSEIKVPVDELAEVLKIRQVL